MRPFQDWGMVCAPSYAAPSCNWLHYSIFVLRKSWQMWQISRIYPCEWNNRPLYWVWALLHVRKFTFSNSEAWRMANIILFKAPWYQFLHPYWKNIWVIICWCQVQPGTVLKRPIMCYVFEKQALQGYEIWYCEGMLQGVIWGWHRGWYGECSCGKSWGKNSSSLAIANLEMHWTGSSFVKLIKLDKNKIN